MKAKIVKAVATMFIVAGVWSMPASGPEKPVKRRITSSCHADTKQFLSASERAKTSAIFRNIESTTIERTKGPLYIDGLLQ